jgi:hypothetical protein
MLLRMPHSMKIRHIPQRLSRSCSHILRHVFLELLRSCPCCCCCSSGSSNRHQSNHGGILQRGKKECQHPQFWKTEQFAHLGVVARRPSLPFPVLVHIQSKSAHGTRPSTASQSERAKGCCGRSSEACPASLWVPLNLLRDHVNNSSLMWMLSLRNGGSSNSSNNEANNRDTSDCEFGSKYFPDARQRWCGLGPDCAR